MNAVGLAAFEVDKNSPPVSTIALIEANLYLLIALEFHGVMEFVNYFRIYNIFKKVSIFQGFLVLNFILQVLSKL